MKNRSELAQEVAEIFNVSADAYNTHSTEDLIAILAEQYNDDTILPQIPAWLAKNVRHLDEQKFNALCHSNDYIYEYKYDGCRAKLHIQDDGSIRVDSRNRSVQTYTYDEKTNNFYYMGHESLKPWKGTVIDCEMMASNSLATHMGSHVTASAALYNSKPMHSLELQHRYGKPFWMAFDCPFWKGEDIRKFEFGTRRSFLLELLQEEPSLYRVWQELRVQLNTINLGGDAQEFFALSRTKAYEGIEGIMFKAKHAHYPTRHGSRTVTMYKWKAQLEQDCFVIGSVPGQGEFEGMIGALTLGVYNADGDVVTVGAIQPGTLETRFMMSHEDGSLKEEYLNQIYEVEFQEWTKHARMRHAVPLRIRYDKQINECVLE